MDEKDLVKIVKNPTNSVVMSIDSMGGMAYVIKNDQGRVVMTVCDAFTFGTNTGYRYVTEKDGRYVGRTMNCVLAELERKKFTKGM